MKKGNDSNQGYTLIEIIVTIIVLGVIVSLAIPNYTMSVEKTKAAEGAQMLEALLNAQRRHLIEYNDYAEGTDINQLDLDIEFGPSTGNFEAPAVSKQTTKVASIKRVGQYRLFIDADGKIYCDHEEAPDGICPKLGYITGDF